MTLAPLISAPAIIGLHVAAATMAFVLGIAQLALPKRGARHRVMGWTWAVLLAAVALTSFWISGGGLSFARLSAIHALSVLTLVALPLGLYAAKRRRFGTHAWIMASLFIGALLIAGVFTLAPGRIMGLVVFGG